MSAHRTISKDSKRLLVPDLCKNSTLLITIVVAELGALVTSLLLHQDGFFLGLGRTSLYYQWSTLLSVALLCAARRRLNQSSALVALAGVFACCIMPFLITELSTQYLLNNFSLGTPDWRRLFSHLAIALIAIFVVIRQFSILAVLEHRNKAEMEQRIQALQSRIRPHFLFNSLNTISELVVVEPKQAEQAISALSMLFRASLESESRFHTLEGELNLCRRYVDLEHWRLQNRLSIDWHIDVADVGAWRVPKLILQPLIENALLHGGSDGGLISVSIDVRESKRDLSLMIENNKAHNSSHNSGNGIAVDNIRERLFVLYDDKQTFRVKESDDTYSVIMRFPKQAYSGVS